MDIERSCNSPQFEMVRMDVHQRSCRFIGWDAWAQTTEWQFDMHSIELDYSITVVSSIQLHCLWYLVPLRGFSTPWTMKLSQGHVNFVVGCWISLGMGAWLEDVFSEFFHVLGITQVKDMVDVRVCYPWHRSKCIGLGLNIVITQEQICRACVVCTWVWCFNVDVLRFLMEPSCCMDVGVECHQ